MFQIFNLSTYVDCLNETFIVPHFSSLATCSFRDCCHQHLVTSINSSLVTGPAPPVSGICFIPLSGTSLSGPDRLPGNKIRTFTTVTWSMDCFALSSLPDSVFEKHILVRCLSKYGLKFCRYRSFKIT